MCTSDPVTPVMMMAALGDFGCARCRSTQLRQGLARIRLAVVRPSGRTVHVDKRIPPKFDRTRGVTVRAWLARAITHERPHCRQQGTQTYYGATVCGEDPAAPDEHQRRDAQASLACLPHGPLCSRWAPNRSATFRVPLRGHFAKIHV
jgi:hypothetical protein